MWDDEPDTDSMYLSALSLNRNTVSFRADPGEAESAPLVVSADPSNRYVTVVNQATTGKAGGACAASVTRRAGDRENLVTVAGSLAPGCAPVVKRLTVWKPELLALTVFSEQLSQFGIAVSSLNVAPTPPDTIPLASMGRPVKDVVTVMLKQSDNLSAESLVKYLGHVATGREGSASSGLTSVASYLNSRGIDAGQLVLADGSGLSRYNLVTAESLVRLLVEAQRDPQISAPFVDGLPVAGKDGTLARRMKGTVAEGTAVAKTGTMTGVSALSGYAVTAAGERLAFSMLMQNFTGSSARIRDIQDQIVMLLNSLPLCLRDSRPEKSP
jgi:serine-type D-Ala-D-Ala carboxypeptidase/endopeptidase (penicillin-binding protein 4)